MNPTPAALNAQAELEWRRCAKDPFYFLETYWYIAHPKGARPFKLRKPQQEVLEIWSGGENSFSLKARQIGWSTLIGGYVFWLAFFRDEANILLLSKGEREAKKLLAKCKFGYKRLPQWMKDRGPQLEDNSTERMTFKNDSAIESLPSTAGRGEAATLTVIDEFAFLNNPEDTWAAVEPTADIGGQIIILSTANGSGNLFHQMWVQATLGLSNFRPSFYGWWAADDRDQAWYERKQRELEPWQLAQEYPDNPEEAFIKSGRMVFPYDVLQQITAWGPKDQWALVGEILMKDENGQFETWADYDPNELYSLGCDTAEGLAHGDFSVIDVLSRDGQQVAQWRGHVEPDILASYVAALGNMYGEALAVVEVNNHGLVTLTALRNLGYSNIYRRPRRPTDKGTFGDLGFQTSRVTKPQIIDELSKSLRADVTVLSAATKSELMNYVLDSKGGMSGSPHDDCVMALALANWGRGFLHLEEYTVERAVQKYSFQWWAEQNTGPVNTGRGIGARNVRPVRS